MMNVRSIFGGSRNFGCGFLSRRQVESFLDGSLDRSRLSEFHEHQLACGECSHLASAMELFRDVVENGVMDAEQDAFRRTERTLKARLRQELERMPSRGGRLPWTRDLSADQLAQIAAAGPEEGAGADPDELGEDGDDEERGRNGGAH